MQLSIFTKNWEEAGNKRSNDQVEAFSSSLKDYASFRNCMKFSLTAISYFDWLTAFFTRLNALCGLGKRKQKYSQNLIIRVIRWLWPLSNMA